MGTWVLEPRQHDIFTLSKKHTLDHLDTIMKRSERILKIGTQTNVATITGNTKMEGTHKDTKFTSLVNIEATYDSVDNAERFMNDMVKNKYKMLKLKDN